MKENLQITDQNESTKKREYPEICKVFGERISNLKEERGLTLLSIGLDLDIDETAICKIIKGNYNATCILVKRFADCQNVSVSYLNGETDRQNLINKVEIQPEDVPKSIAKRMYELRMRKEMTQKDLGEIIGVSNKTISKMEIASVTGCYNFTNAQVKALADYFNVSSSYLYGETNDEERFSSDAGVT